MSIIPLQPPRHVLNIYRYQHSTVEKYHRFFSFFSVLPACERTTQVCIIHLYTPADYLYATQSHTRARVHTYTDTDTYTHP